MEARGDAGMSTNRSVGKVREISVFTAGLEIVPTLSDSGSPKASCVGFMSDTHTHTHSSVAEACRLN